MPAPLIHSPEMQAFIMAHLHHDPATLALQARKYPGIDLRYAAAQIAARQKSKLKLPAWYAAENAVFPLAISMEQCSSEATARYKASLIQGHVLLDLTGGFGVDATLFAGSFTQVHYVEQNAALAQLVAHNAAVLGTHNLITHTGEATAILPHLPPADWIYLDPARRSTGNQKIAQLHDAEPNILELLPALWQNTDNILLKTSPMLDIELARQALHSVAEIHVVALEGECKEVLYILKKDFQGEPQITALNLLRHTQQTFVFTRSGERKAQAAFSLPAQYLYEPNAALLKAGAFKGIGDYFKLDKLHPDTHLYTSDLPVFEFPGRIFKILSFRKYDPKTLAAQLPDRKANIATRNFPLTVAEIRKQTRLTDGGSTYLFAARLIDNTPAIIFCEKI